MPRFGLYAALALCIYGLPASAEERFERWSLEQPGDFIFALSFKRSISFDDRAATSELAFLCNQEEKYAAVVLMPLDGTFKSRQTSIPVVVQKDRNAVGLIRLDATLGKRSRLHIFGIARCAGATCLVPKGQRSRGCEIRSFLFPQRPRYECADNQSHGRLTLRDFQVEWRHLQADANKRSSWLFGLANRLRRNLRLGFREKPRLYD